jgi:outer membrane protein assembly factor BamD (BamD/ComL family)
MSQEELWELANNQFRHENYLNAIEILTTYTLNYSGSTNIDSAQYLLAESHFALGEYILAESEYNRMLRNTPQSYLAPEAQIKIVLSNAYLSPSAGLDQKFTERTIAGAQNYKEDYSDANVYVRLTRRVPAWQTLGRIVTVGIWHPRQKTLEEADIFETKVVYPHYETGFGHWMLKVLTFGIYRSPTPRLVVPSSQEMTGEWVINRAFDDGRGRLAKKEFRAGELYFHQKKYPSAVIYFDRVLDLYADTFWAKPALQLKGDAMFNMKKYSEAVGVYTKYLSQYGDDSVQLISKRLEESRRPPPLLPIPKVSDAPPDSTSPDLNP